MSGVQDCSGSWLKENGIDVEFIPIDSFLKLTAEGKLVNAHHVAIVGLAIIADLIKSSFKK